MGKFETEYDLFNCNTLENSFVSSGLTDITQTNGTNIIQLTKRYILEHA